VAFLCARHFQEEIESKELERLRLCQADVLESEFLPPSWIDYDLILSLSVLGYLPIEQLPFALARLRARLAVGGQ
jgi:hypothetical protein